MVSFLFDGGGFHPSTSVLSKSFSPNILWKFWAEKNTVNCILKLVADNSKVQSHNSLSLKIPQ